jgi:hypothetical protein
MNKKTKLVLDLLRPKAAPLGFSKEELEGVARNIADNLSLDDDVTDEVLTEAATKAVDAAMPLLEMSQKNANRIIQKNKEEREKAEAEAKKKAEEEAAAKAEEERKAKEEAERKAKEEAERKKAEEEGLARFLESDFAKNMKAENKKLAEQLKAQQAAAQQAQAEFASFRDEFNAMKAERLKATRQSRLDELVKGAGVYGERIKKNYAKMTFDSDADFDEFCSGIEEDIKAFNQERADKGLETLGTPATGGLHDSVSAEPMSDEEADALAAIM